MATEKENRQPVAGMDYEQASNELEQLVQQLETGQLPLEDTLKLYERGQELARHCTGLLTQAELRIRTLTADADGGLQEES